MQDHTAKVNTYLCIIMPQSFHPFRIALERHSINLLHLNMVFFRMRASVDVETRWISLKLAWLLTMLAWS